MATKPQAKPIQRLTFKSARAAARRYYLANRLTAQMAGSSSSSSRCVYHLGKHRCAIGAGLTRATLRLIDESALNSGCGVKGLVDFGVVKASPASLRKLVELQEAHDSWLSWVSRVSPSSNLQFKRFKDLIGVK